MKNISIMKKSLALYRKNAETKMRSNVGAGNPDTVSKVNSGYVLSVLQYGVHELNKQTSSNCKCEKILYHKTSIGSCCHWHIIFQGSEG
jgi:hypothetical protein